MTNPYLERLRGQIQEKQNPSRPSKLSKLSSEGFEGEQGWRISENRDNHRTAEPCANSTARNEQRGTLTNPQNLQNLRSPSAPGDGTRVTIVQLPAVGLRYRRTFAHLQLRPPDYVPEDRWRMAITDGRTFLREWGSQAQALNWSARDLFGLVPVPPHAKPNFNRLSRYDQLGLCWTLEGRAKVVALTGKAAVIRTSTGARLTYHRHGRPALGPVGDSLEDFAP
jgi:hypothetical protein